MKLLPRVFFALFLLLMIASFATCHFGVQQEINKIPPEIRSQMSDFDWVGVEWIGRGILIQIFAVGFLIASFIIWLIKSRRSY